MTAYIRKFAFCCLVMTEFWTLNLAAKPLDFEVVNNRTWRLDGARDDLSIYRNTTSKTYEMVLTRVIRQNAATVALTGVDAPGLEKSREGLMGRFGLTGYHVLDVSRVNTAGYAADAFLSVHSRFRMVNRGDVQMFEWQYAIGSKVYVVTYLNDAPAINDAEHVNQILHRFKPRGATRLPDRSPAAETAVVGNSPPTDVDRAASASPTPALTIIPPALDQTCASVPPEKRRRANDLSAQKLLPQWLGTSPRCIRSQLEQAWASLSSAASYAFDSAYRSQVHAAVGVIYAELSADPGAYLARVLASVYEASRDFVTEGFACLRPKHQLEVLCDLAANLIPGGTTMKI